MFDQNRLHFYTQIADQRQHWCPHSQRYAGGDALITRLNDGWEVSDEIYYEEYWHGGSRKVLIYNFVLVNHEDTVTMRVLSNPFVERFVSELNIDILPARAGRQVEREKIGVRWSR